jgi:hypothetical protein
MAGQGTVLDGGRSLPNRDGVWDTTKLPVATIALELARDRGRGATELPCNPSHRPPGPDVLRDDLALARGELTDASTAWSRWNATGRGQHVPKQRGVLNLQAQRNRRKRFAGGPPTPDFFSL